MRVLLASVAYLTFAAGGVQMLVAAAHTFATAASPLLALPITKPTAPSLVERREIEQASPLPESQPLRRVVALTAPQMPLAVLARGLDEAETAYEETAYEEPQAVSATEVLDASLVAPLTVRDVIKDSATPLLQVAALEITRAEFDQPTIALSSKRRPKGQGAAKRKPKAVLAAKSREQVVLASLETPGNLMTRGFLKRQS